MVLGYAKGKRYSEMESKRKPENDLAFWWVTVPRMVKLFQKYVDRKITEKDIRNWILVDKAN